jgi:hypothetical protein
MVTKKEKSRIGKRSRALGKQFEVRVRKDLEGMGFVVCRFDGNVVDGKLVQSKPKFNPYTKRIMNMSSGFPDYIAYKIRKVFHENLTVVYMVECKMTGKLDKEEKEKAKWYKDNNLCHKFYIAKKIKVKNKIEIEYLDA